MMTSDIHVYNTFSISLIMRFRLLMGMDSTTPEHDDEVSQAPSIMCCHPERSEGSAHRERSFAALRMTGPALVVKAHHHARIQMYHAPTHVSSPLIVFR